ncbi:MAG: YgiQ family radical SAM protein, partial [Bacillota bacterium]
MKHNFLPLSQKELSARGWQQLDFIIISGDAYVDHPSFGTAIIGRLLEAKGFRVGIIAQPDWNNLDEFKKLGRPSLGFLISAGNLDSMVSNYSVSKKKRKADAYSPGGRTGLRPDRAVVVYAQKAREAYPGLLIILGGIEASLRRLAHYDYWDNRVRRSILLDAKADLLIYGMAEKAVIATADALQSGLNINDLNYIKGTVYRSNNIDDPEDTVMLPSYDEVSASREAYARSFMLQHQYSDTGSTIILAEPYEHGYVMQNPPAEPLTTDELDTIYRLPFARTYHPVYEKAGGVPAISEVKFSLVSHRGCFGGCSFCALHFHQGRTVQSRSIEAITEEAEALIRDPDFKGYIHDVGGPTANFRSKPCSRQEKGASCAGRMCLFPEPCPNLKVDHSEYLELLRRLRKLKGIKKVFVRSGIRHDYLLLDQNDTFMRELCAHHISGQLKVAPEHVSPLVLNKMGKPGRKVYRKFKQKYKALNRELGKDQYLVPYYMSSHPGSTLEAAIELASFIKKHEHMPEQVQDFYPTPGTLSTCMYYTGLDPRNMEEIYVPKTAHEKAMQRALIQFSIPKNYQLVHEALKLAGREDLIGYERKCLLKPHHINK